MAFQHTSAALAPLPVVPPTPVPERPRLSEAGPALEVRAILQVIAERYRIILALGAAGLLLGLGLSLLTTPRYRATVTLQYDPQATDSLEQTRGASFRPQAANQEMMATQVGLLQSDALALRVAQDLNLAANPHMGGQNGARAARAERAAAMITAGTEVEAVKNSLLLRLSYSSTDPRLAAQVASALAQGFIASSLERRYSSGSYARHFLADQLARTKTALEESERAVNDYTMRTGLFSAPGQVVDGKASESVTLTVTDLAAMEEALNQARVKRITAESAWRNGVADHGQSIAAMSPLTQQRAILAAQYAEKLKTFKPEYPAMQEMAAQLAQLDSEISHARTGHESDQRSDLLAAYRAALQAETDLAARVANAKSAIQDERGRSIQYTILQREADTNRAQYDALLQRFKDVDVSSGIGQSNILLVDDARVPRAPYRPRTVLNSALGLFTGLIVGLIAAFAIHLVFDTLILPADIREKLGLKVLGIVPLDTAGGNLWETLADRKSTVSEAYYSTLTAIRFARAQGEPRSLFITSTGPGEGKSTTAYALATTSARLGRRVLLIDADLRRPTFSGGENEGKGLAQLLASDEPLALFLRPTATPLLSLLPAGDLQGAVAELLSSVRLPAVLAEALASFDLVVLDGPPVLGLTDAPLLGAGADATVLVVESRKTRTSSAHDAIRRLRESGNEPLGVILTKTTRKGAHYGYDYNYSYGHAGVEPKLRFDPNQPLTMPER